MLDAAQLPAFQSLLDDVGEWWQAQDFNSDEVDRILSDLDKRLAGQVDGKGLATGMSPLLWPVSVVGVTRERFLVGQIFKALSSMKNIADAFHVAGAFHVAALAAASLRGGGALSSRTNESKNSTRESAISRRRSRPAAGVATSRAWWKDTTRGRSCSSSKQS